MNFFYKIKYCKKIYQSSGFQYLIKVITAKISYGVLNKTKKSLIYPLWLKIEGIKRSDINLIKKHIELLSYQPKISILMPVYNTPKVYLIEAIESVQEQLYPNWELCIVDDASTQPYIREVLNGYAAQDTRIKVAYREVNGHISEATNTALSMATGEFIALFDHDDKLAKHALYLVVERLNRNPDLDLIYSDEDKIDKKNKHFDPHMKPDWDPILLLHVNYVSHLGVYRSSIAKAIGGFRPGFEGAQDYDFLLRFVEQTDASKIAHLPYVLYHWRAIESSTAQSISSKNYALDAAKLAVNEHLMRRGIPAKAVANKMAPIYQELVFNLPSVLPKVAIIIPTKDRVDLLKTAIDSIVKYESHYPHFEIIVIDNNSSEAESFAYFEQLQSAKIKVVKDSRPFNWAAINNAAAFQSDADLFLFLNNDIEVISADWLVNLVGFSFFPEVAVVGAKLYYENDTIQHAGVTLGTGGVAGHIYKAFPRQALGYFAHLMLSRCYSAVTGACMLVKRDVFLKLNGFDEKLAVAFNDIDFCIRVIKAGYKIVYAHKAELYHYESLSRGCEDTPEKKKRFKREVEYVINLYEDILYDDPSYNPNFSLKVEKPELDIEPRLVKPWKIKKKTRGV